MIVMPEGEQVTRRFEYEFNSGSCNLYERGGEHFVTAGMTNGLDHRSCLANKGLDMLFPVAQVEVKGVESIDYLETVLIDYVKRTREGNFKFECSPVDSEMAEEGDPDDYFLTGIVDVEYSGRDPVEIKVVFDGDEDDGDDYEVQGPDDEDEYDGHVEIGLGY